MIGFLVLNQFLKARWFKPFYLFVFLLLRHQQSIEFRSTFIIIPKRSHSQNCQEPSISKSNSFRILILKAFLWRQVEHQIPWEPWVLYLKGQIDEMAQQFKGRLVEGPYKPLHIGTVPSTFYIIYLAILLVTFLGWWGSRDPFKGCWWSPTFGNKKFTAWITWYVYS